MKKILALLAFAAVSLLADDITTIDGKVYNNATVVAEGSDALGISIKHTTTGRTAKVLFSQMTEADKVKYGYDPAKEKAALAKQAAEQAAAKPAAEANKTKTNDDTAKAKPAAEAKAPDEFEKSQADLELREKTEHDKMEAELDALAAAAAAALTEEPDVVAKRSRLGETVLQCVARYGRPKKKSDLGGGSTWLKFRKGNYDVEVWFHDGKAWRITYTASVSALSGGEIEAFLKAGGGDKKWKYYQKSDDGAITSRSFETEDGTVLAEHRVGWYSDKVPPDYWRHTTFSVFTKAGEDRRKVEEAAWEAKHKAAEKAAEAEKATRLLKEL